MDLQHILNRILEEVRGAWRFRWISVAAAWAVCIVGWLIVGSLPDTYEATARVYVDTRGILRPLLQGLAINPDVASGLDVVRQALLSRPQIERVAHETDLDGGANTPEKKELLLRSLQDRISIAAADNRARTTQGEGLYLIKFRDHDRTKSVEVVSQLLRDFVGNAMVDKRSGQETAQRFLENQIAEYEQRLSAAESRLADFKKANVGLMPDSRGDYFGRLQQESAELDKNRGDLAVAESRLAEINRQLSGEEPFLFGFDSGAGAPKGQAGDLTARIQELEKQLDDLLLKYTEKHPEVIATRQQIAELKQRQQDELARIKSGHPATGSLSDSLKANPLYQSLELEQKKTQVSVAELRQQVSQSEAKVGELKREVNAVPEVEAELARLNRDYDVTRQKYTELVQRRETATLSEQADRTGTVKFDIIEPPSAAIRPVLPNRPRLLTLVLLAGLGAGAGMAWLLNQMRPVFNSVRALTEATGLPVLAAVSRAWVERHRRQRWGELLKLSAVTCLLLLAFGVAVAFQQFGLHLTK